MMAELDRGVMSIPWASCTAVHGNALMTDIDKALMAGLLPWLRQMYFRREQDQALRQIPSERFKWRRPTPACWHAKLGAFLAAKKYHVDDRRLWTPLPPATPEGPHVAAGEDYLYRRLYRAWQGRTSKYGGSTETGFHDIDACLYRILKDSLVYLDSRNIPIDPMSREIISIL